MKLFGSMLLLAGCSGAGIILVKRLENRAKILQSMISVLEIMEREMGFRLSTLDEIIDAARRDVSGPVKEFLCRCLTVLNEKCDVLFSEIWSQALNECLPMLNWTDRESMLALGAVLGRYDAESQKQMIEHVRMRLEESLAEAKKECRSHGKVYRTVGATAGALLVILLL